MLQATEGRAGEKTLAAPRPAHDRSWGTTPYAGAVDWMAGDLDDGGRRPGAVMIWVRN